MIKTEGKEMNSLLFYEYTSKTGRRAIIEPIDGERVFLTLYDASGAAFLLKPYPSIKSAKNAILKYGHCEFQEKAYMKG